MSLPGRASVTRPRWDEGTGRRWPSWLRGGIGSWLFLLPAVVFFVAYQLYPLCRVVWISFTDDMFLTSAPARWIGFDNYIAALADPLLWHSLWRAVYFTIIFLPGMVALPLLLAVLVDRVENPYLAGLYRVVLVIPALIPGTLVFVLWKWMYNFQIGPINHLLVDVLGLFTLRNAPQWLGGTSLTLPSIAAMEVWWGLGYHTIFFLAGLTAIPKQLPEAARIDGASEWQVFWHVTRPRLTPIIAVLVVLRFGSAMTLTDEYLIFGGFQRDSPTYTWTVFMYDQAFKLGLWRQGFAAAIGMIGTIVMVLVVTLMLRGLRSRD